MDLDSENAASAAPLKWYILGPVVAVVGMVFALPAMALQEMGYGWYIGPFIAAPVIEEAAKPAGVYWLLAKKPQALPSQQYTAFLAALAGLSFGIIENLLYLEVYIPDHSTELAIWRWTVCIGVHTVCSFIVGWGINQNLVAWVRGEVTLMEGSRKFFLTAMAIHAAYNIFAYLLETRWEWFPDTAENWIGNGLF